MSKVPMGPHEPDRGGNWWNRMGWMGEEEYEETLVASCGRCGSVEVLDDYRDEKLCQDCWHAARSAETPYAVYRDEDGRCVCDGAYTKEEAEDWAQEKRDGDAKAMACWIQCRDDADSESARAHWQRHLDHIAKNCHLYGQYTAKPCKHWWGERIAHNGYMNRRRRALRSSGVTI
jgi:hypothetical protein